MTYFVYYLIDPAAGVFYVGLTCIPEERRRAHQRGKCRSTKAKIKAMWAAGRRFEMVLFAGVPRKLDALRLENTMIELTLGKLLNTPNSKHLVASLS